MSDIKSEVPVMHFCEFCWEVLNDDGTCPTEDCIHNELIELEAGEDNDTSQA